MEQPGALGSSLLALLPAGRREIAIGPAVAADLLRERLVQLEPLRLAILLVPRQIQPVQPFVDGVQRFFRIALEIRVVDAQNHGAAVTTRVQPVEDKSARAADVEKASGRGGKTDAQHGNASITAASRWAGFPA